MPPRAPPTSEFDIWACARLRALHEARCDDHRRGVSRKHSKFGALLRHYMQEYEEQPFARASYKERYDRNGKLVTSDDALRKMADNYLRNHSREPLARLALFEQAGGLAADHPHKAATAMETWAGAHKELINPLVCAELDIPAETAPADWPDNWIGTRKAVVSREFRLLPEDEQQEWRNTALDRKMKLDAEAALPVVVQSRQEEFNGQLTTLLKKKFANKGLGNTFFVGWFGFYIGADDHTVHRFRGQNSSYKTQMWAESKQYTDHVVPAWTDFVRKQTEGHHVPHLPRMPVNPSVGELKGLRTFFKDYLQTMFDLAVDGPAKINTAKFWDDVAERPFDFVISARIPEGGRFADPTTLTDEEFKILYQHVFQSQEQRNEVDPSVRFRFEELAIQTERVAMRALRLDNARGEGRSKGTASSEEGQGTVPPVDGSTVSIAAQPTLNPSPTSSSGAAIVCTTTEAPDSVRSAPMPASSATPVTAPTSLTAVPVPVRARARARARAAVPDPTPTPSPAPASATGHARLPSPAPANGTAAVAQVDTAASPVRAEGSKKRKRANSIPHATAEELAEMGDSLGARGYKTRNRKDRRPVQTPTSSRLGGRGRKAA